MEKIDFKKQNIPFTQVANGVLNDKKLSPGAKGIYAYLYSKPEGWDFASKRIAADMNCGQRAILGMLNELKECGYLKTQRLPNGRMLYMVIFPPIEPDVQNSDVAQNPNVQNATLLKQQTAETATVSNKDSYKVIKSISNKENAETSSATNKDIKIDSIEQVIKKLEDDKRRSINIIALYIEHRKKTVGPNIKNMGQLHVFIKRHIRSATQLATYSDAQIVDAFEQTSRTCKDIDWTLETIIKTLTK